MKYGLICPLFTVSDDVGDDDVADFVKEGTCGIGLAFSLSGSKSSISKLELASRLIRSVLDVVTASNDWKIRKTKSNQTVFGGFWLLRIKFLGNFSRINLNWGYALKF